MMPVKRINSISKVNLHQEKVQATNLQVKITFYDCQSNMVLGCETEQFNKT